MTKKLIALFLALVTCFGVLAGCTDGPGNIDIVEKNLKGATINICVPYQDGVKHNECYLTGAVENHLECTLEYTELDDFGSTYVTQLSDGVAPDLTWYSGYSATYEQYGLDGAYINIYDYLDKMPNVKKYLEENSNLVKDYQVSENELYVLPQADIGGDAAIYAYLYREDIFQKHNLTWPTNQDEFYNTLKALKAAYPNSTPFTMRNLNGSIQGAQSWGFLWGASHLLAGQYNTIFMLDADGKYICAETSTAYKEMGQFIQKLRDEGLMDKSSLTHTTQTWTEALASDRAFITYDKVDRLPELNYAGKSSNPNFQLIAGDPFNMGSYASQTTQVTTSWGGNGATGYWYIGYNENLSATLKYVDWMFSEEGFTMHNWGVKGESYDVDENGNKYFIQSFLDKYKGSLSTAGLNYDTLGGNWDYEAFLATCDEKLIQSLAVAEKYAGKTYEQEKLRYNSEERRVWDSYYQAYANYARAEWMKFVIGQRKWEDFDKLQQELTSKYHQDELMNIHESALARKQGK